jgi:NADH-quinone oxidoreductase subunit H
MMNLFYILVFPGLLFLIVFALAAEYIDRKLCARLQNRVGPPWFQPLADLIKLVGKQDTMPEGADRKVFTVMPVLALTAAVTAFLYIPIWGNSAFNLFTGANMSFSGDVIVVFYLLTIPTLTFFLGGWYSRSVYAMLGAARSIMQLFAYEVPLLLAILAPAMLVTGGNWSLAGMTKFYQENPLYMLANLPGFVIAIVALLGKLEKVPFDIPEAETEIVAGPFTEYGGRLLAVFRLCLNVEMVVGASLVAAVFLPFGLDIGGDSAGMGSHVAVFGLYIVKVLLIVCLISLLRTVMARLRLDQMISLFWRVVAPAALAQLLIDLVLKAVVKAA